MFYVFAVKRRNICNCNFTKSLENGVYWRTTKKSLLIDLTSMSEDIEKIFVSEKTTSIYNGILVRFIVWLFDNHKHHIEPFIMGDPMDCHKKDKLEELNPPIPKTSKKKKSNGDNELLCKHLRASCKRHLANIKPSMNRLVHNSLIVIEGGGENELSYTAIREFSMGSRKKSVVINEETVTLFLKKMKKNDNSAHFNQEEYVNDGKVEVAAQQSISSYESIRSSIGLIYKMGQVPMPKLMQDNLKMLLSGKRRAGLEEKEGFGLSITEDKRPLSQEAYELLAKTLFLMRKRNIFLLMCFSY